MIIILSDSRSFHPLHASFSPLLIKPYFSDDPSSLSDINFKRGYPSLTLFVLLGLATV